MPVSLPWRTRPRPSWRWRGPAAPIWQRHGLLAPGVWVMRRLSLFQKAWLALLAVTLPMLPMQLQEARALRAAEQRLQQEDAGLRLLAQAERQIQSAAERRSIAEDAQLIHTLVGQLKRQGLDASQAVSGLQAAVTGLSMDPAGGAGADALRLARRFQAELLGQVHAQAEWARDEEVVRAKVGLYHQLDHALLQQEPSARPSRMTLLNELLSHVRTQQAHVADQRFMLSLLLMLSAVLGGYLIVSAHRVLQGGLAQVTAGVQRLRQGDLTQQPPALGRDELGRVIDDLGLASQKLADLLASAGMGVQAVSHASQQVALGNADLAHRNRASTDKVASAVEGVVQYTRQLEACRSEVQLVVNAIDALMLEAARSRHQMGKLVDTMRTLSGRSNEIGDIVSLIDGIAFRTNVLALNASVEANKAGELGKGFAVVAQEVRSLALKAAQSAQRIGGVVHASTEDIGLSTALAQEAETQFGRMDVHVGQIKEASERVANMTREGEAESENILEELRHIKGGMDQNLKLVEQLHAASEALSMQSERLQIKLAQFKLN